MDPNLYYSEVDALADLVCYQRETIKQLRNKLDRVKLHAKTLDSEELYWQANAAGETVVCVPKKLIEELRGLLP